MNPKIKSVFFYDVWRLVSITHRGNEIWTDQTHLCVKKNVLWEVWPEEVYYEGEPGPERPYSLEWIGEDLDGVGKLKVHIPNRGSFCYIIKLLPGGFLEMRLGQVFGQFPESFDDEWGNLYRYEKERDQELVAKLMQAPPQVPRPSRTHKQLGKLCFNANYHWWESKVQLADGDDVTLYVEGTKDTEDSHFDQCQLIIDKLDINGAKSFASSKLLTLKNESWLGDDEQPLDETAFMSKLVPMSIELSEDKTVDLTFNDGGLFYGHVVLVNLDAQGKCKSADIAG
jgi:hypothetical protein